MKPPVLVSTKSSPRQTAGFSLVELMIALTLGLIITGVVIQIFTSSKSTYDQETGLSEIQEQGRFAMEFLAYDIRMAGNFGCARLDKLSINNIVRNPQGYHKIMDDPFNPNSKRPAGIAVFQYTGSGGTALTDWTPPLPADGIFDGLGGGTPDLVPHSDVLLVQYAKPLNIQLFNPGAPTRADLQIVNTPETIGVFDQDDIVMVTDCERADVFRVTNNPRSTASGNNISLSHGASGNTTPLLDHAYDNSADVMKLATRAYFIGVNVNNSPEPALYRMASDSNNWAPEPLVEGVETMRFMLGMDMLSTDLNARNGGTAHGYLIPEEMATAAPPRDFSRIVDVKVAFGVRSTNVVDVGLQQQDIVIKKQMEDIFGHAYEYFYSPAGPQVVGGFDPEQFRVRKQFQMTVQKRNI